MSRCRLFYHLVWSTKDRQPMIDPTIEAEVHRQLRVVAQRHGVVVHAVGGVDDHVHLAVSIPPTLKVSDAVRRIKGGSSFALRADIASFIGWQREYSIDSFSERHLPNVVAYITNQRQHHRDRTTIATIEPVTDDAD